MEKSNNSSLKILLAIVLVVLLISIGLLFYFLWQGFQATQNALQPVNELSNSISTQVSQLINPTPTVLPDPITIIHSVRSIARLETIQYSVEKVITAENNQGPFGFLFGDRLLLVAHGVVIAGMDLGKMGVEDIWVKNNVLHVSLPEAEIFITSLDNEQSYVYDRDLGILTKGNMHLETAARRAAEIEIEKAAIKDGILKLAMQNGQAYLERFLLQLGYPEVIFVE